MVVCIALTPTINMYTHTLHIYTHTLHIYTRHTYTHIYDKCIFSPFPLLLLSWLLAFPSVLTFPWSWPLLFIHLLPFFIHKPYSHLRENVSLPWTLPH